MKNYWKQQGTQMGRKVRVRKEKAWRAFKKITTKLTKMLRKLLLFIKKLLHWRQALGEFCCYLSKWQCHQTYAFFLSKTKTTSKSQRKRSDAPKKYKHEVRSAHDTNFRRTGVEVGAMHSASSGYVLKSGPVSCSTPPTSAGRNHVPVNAANPCAYAGKASSRPNFCGSCGAAVLGAGKFCGECGTAIC